MDRVIIGLYDAIQIAAIDEQPVFNAALQTGTLPARQAVPILEAELADLGYVYHGFQLSEPLTACLNQGTTLTLLGVRKAA